MTDCSSPDCAYPTMESAWICKVCLQRLRRDLGDIPALVEDLHITLSRQDKLGANGGRKSAETALPFKPTASEALWELVNTVTTWARELIEHSGVPPQQTPPDAASAARWLLRYSQSMAMHPAAGEAVDELASAVAEAYRVIDRPPDLLLAGQCGHEGCEEYLYAAPEATITTCRRCGAEHSVDERRAWMMTYAAEMSLPTSTCLAWVRQLMGKQIPRGTWDSWVSRGRIEPNEYDHVGSPLWKFGDVRDLAAEWVARPRRGAAA